MPEKQWIPASPGVSYLECLVDSFAKDCHPKSPRTEEQRRVSRAHANNLSRFLVWGVIDLAQGTERAQLQQLANRLQRIGTDQADVSDFPFEADKSDLLLERLEEWGLRFERRLAEFAPQRRAHSEAFHVHRGGAL